jgi:hypothetical protein
MTNKKKKPSASGMARMTIQRDMRGTMAVRGKIAVRSVAMARRKNPRP